MPIYEYKCNACGHQFDKLQKVSDSALKDCPKCGKPDLTKLISAAGFKLKGTGWYETDFKGTKKPDDAKKVEPKKDEPKKTETKSSSSRDSIAGSTNGDKHS